jgi:hypothetical protein
LQDRRSEPRLEHDATTDPECILNQRSIQQEGESVIYGNSNQRPTLLEREVRTWYVHAQIWTRDDCSDIRIAQLEVNVQQKLQKCDIVLEIWRKLR